MAIGDIPESAIAYLTGPHPAGSYQRHRPEQSLLYQIVGQHYPTFRDLMEAQDRELPAYVQRDFDDYLKCGRLEHGFSTGTLRQLPCRASGCFQLYTSWILSGAPSPSCDTLRMTESAALLMDDVLPCQPVRQWVLSFPFQLRYLFANRPAVMGLVLGIVYRVIATHLIKKAGFKQQNARTGAVTLIKRYSSVFTRNVNSIT